MNKSLILTIAISTSTCTIGAAVGYFFAKKKLEKQFDERLKAEVEETRAFYKKVYKEDEFQTPEKAAEALIPAAARAIRNYQGVPARNIDVDGQLIGDKYLTDLRQKLVEVDSNVFTQGGSTETIDETDIRNRTEEAPYPLSKDEFFNNESNYIQSTLTYYAGDAVLMDAREDVIEDVDNTIGVDNLSKFGYGSGDPNVVYVRNDALDLEFEILRHGGKYSKDVAGLDT
jgi:uncharacterized protein YneF (UPF0154 family)